MDLARAEGIPDDDILTIPDDVGGRYSVFTPAGLLLARITPYRQPRRTAVPEAETMSMLLMTS